MGKYIDQRSQLKCPMARQQMSEVSWYKCIAHCMNGGKSGEIEGVPKREAAALLEMMAAIPKLGPASLDLLFCFVLSREDRNFPMFKL